MCRIGIDVGSSYTKYCVMEEEGEPILFLEKTPLAQKQYFVRKLQDLRETYGDISVISCGYGKNNVAGLKRINELTALAAGSFYAYAGPQIVLDIGGQDTKVIYQEKGKLREFFVNDKCAAGSGAFLSNICNLLEIPFETINLNEAEKPAVKLSSVCAVFAQSEIVELLAADTPPEEILRAVIWHILIQAAMLMGKVQDGPVLLSGGLSQIEGIEAYAQLALDRECFVVRNGSYLSAIGCALKCGSPPGGGSASIHSA